MADIRVDLFEPLHDGMDIKFKAPCDCSEIDGLIVYYPLDDGSGTGSQTFTFKDSHGNDLTGLGDLFTEGVLVKVMVDVDASAAYIQNADTNAYLEEKLGSGGGSGWTVLSRGMVSSQTARLINFDGASSTLAEPITIPVEGMVEFELIAYGVGSSGYSGTLTLVSSSGATMGKLVINGSNYSANRKSTCLVNWSNTAVVYTEEGEDYVSTIQNSIPWSRSHGYTRANSLTITGYKWSAAQDILCYGYMLRYRILE